MLSPLVLGEIAKAAGQVMETASPAINEAREAGGTASSMTEKANSPFHFVCVLE